MVEKLFSNTLFGANGLFNISYGESNAFPSEKQVKFRRVLTESSKLRTFKIYYYSK